MLHGALVFLASLHVTVAHLRSDPSRQYVQIGTGFGWEKVNFLHSDL